MQFNSFSKSLSKQFVGLWFVFIRKQQMSGKCITFLAMFAPQYKTRYPFYRLVGWWAGVLVMFFSYCSGIQTSVLWVINPRLYQLNHKGTPPPTSHLARKME